MGVTTYGENLIKVTSLGFVNSYLVRESDGLTLVDTGMFSANAILSAAKANGGEIKRIIITHAHADHVGSLDALMKHIHGVEIITSAQSARFMAGDMTLTTEQKGAEATGGKLRGSYQKVDAKPTSMVNHGDTIGSLEVHFSPGHTPDHIALIDTRDKTLIAGDAYVVKGGIVVSGTLKWLFPFPALATWHKPTALKSAIYLRDLNPSRLAVGHGKVLENPVSQMTLAIAEAQSEVNVGAAIS
ncbi:MAG: MBL fold metallo-hydrolase [Aggregatilineales bacterium]